MSLRTPLYQQHLDAGGRLVDFAGWQLPVHYGSQVDEHHAVRREAGVFDVSHMTLIEIEGDGASAWLRRLLSNDVARLVDGRALYSCLCAHDGGVIDDLIAYRIDDHHYRLIVNAATRRQDIEWLQQHLDDDVSMRVLEDTALLAVQGPQALERVTASLPGAVPGCDIPDIDPATLARFGFVSAGDVFVARTGYTGEDGVEIALPAAAAPGLWNALLAADVVPCGLGARDTLRLEAGLALYGNDLDLQHSPVESGLAWTVDLRDSARAFIGRDILERHKTTGGRFRQVALVLQGRGVMRQHQRIVLNGEDIGEVTSGGFSPTLQKSIALARVSRPVEHGCDVMIRDKPVAALPVPLPFVRNGAANL